MELADLLDVFADDLVQVGSLSAVTASAVTAAALLVHGSVRGDAQNLRNQDAPVRTRTSDLCS